MMVRKKTTSLALMSFSFHIFNNSISIQECSVAREQEGSRLGSGEEEVEEKFQNFLNHQRFKYFLFSENSSFLWKNSIGYLCMLVW